MVERQLMALGLLEPEECSGMAAARAGADDDAAMLASIAAASSVPAPSDGGLPVPKAVRTSVQRAMTALCSFLERAHGLRAHGMVTEWVQSSPSGVTLLSVHAVQWDARSSRGRLGTFTDRWSDFMAGDGPPPTARSPAKRNFVPGLLGTKPR